MYDVGGEMNAAGEPRTANAVSSPSQTPGQAGRLAVPGRLSLAAMRYRETGYLFR
jgi:hypothetical protein